jgi:hypothetical protein
MTDQTIIEQEEALDLATLQSSAVLPSEAMIEAGKTVWLRYVEASAEGEDREAVVAIYTAMRATTPTAPVQDDDAERLMREFYLSASYDPKAKRPADNVKAAIAFALSSRLSPTPETGLVEAHD